MKNDDGKTLYRIVVRDRHGRIRRAYPPVGTMQTLCAICHLYLASAVQGETLDTVPAEFPAGEYQRGVEYG